MVLKGQIISINGGFYDIKSENKIMRVRGRGNLRHQALLPLVGDLVLFEKDKFLLEILKRKNAFIRPKVANIDQAVIIMSIVEPEYDHFLLHSLLALFEFHKVKPIIVFTKTDLTTKSFFKEFNNQGFKVLEISNLLQTNIGKLTKILQKKLTVFMGQSGVGKSSTINSITKGNLKVGLISPRLRRGRHTTRLNHIVEYNNIRLIDTPGFGSFTLELTKNQLSKSFNDFRHLAVKCEYKNCLHNYEKNCAIKQAVVDQKITEQRYKDYLLMLSNAKS